MTARNQPPAKPEVPLENLKPRRGMLVTLHEEPGVWQIMDKSGAMVGGWGLSPWDDAAREATPDKAYGSYRVASYRTMRPANER